MGFVGRELAEEAEKPAINYIRNIGMKYRLPWKLLCATSLRCTSSSRILQKFSFRTCRSKKKRIHVPVTKVEKIELKK